jgi:hypothetical protein
MDEINTKKTRDRQKKLKLNILDIVILLIAAFFVLLLVMFFFPKTADAIVGDKTYDITYTVVFSGIDYDIAEEIVDNLQVVDTETGAVIGSVAGAPTSETYYQMEIRHNLAGMPVLEKVEYSDKINLTVDITAKAEYSEGKGYTVNGSRIACGREYGLRISSAYEGKAVCAIITVNAD